MVSIAIFYCLSEEADKQASVPSISSQKNKTVKSLRPLVLSSNQGRLDVVYGLQLEHCGVR